MVLDGVAKCLAYMALRPLYKRDMEQLRGMLVPFGSHFRHAPRRGPGVIRSCTSYDCALMGTGLLFMRTKSHIQVWHFCCAGTELG